MPKRLLLGLAALLSIGLLVSRGAAAQPLRIVTFNAEILEAPGKNGSRLQRFRWSEARERHLEKVASVIETLEPDVLNLVEVTSQEAVEALVKILHEKGLTDYRGYHVESEDRFSGLDVALITRIPPDKIDGEEIRLVYSPRGDDAWREKYSYVDSEGKQHDSDASLSRSALYYVTVGDHKLGFLGLHLKSNPDDTYANARRTAEARVAQRAVRELIVAKGYLPIVLGDVNDYDPDVPDRDPKRSTKTKVLADLKNYDTKSAKPELVNAAVKIQREADRYTSHWDRNENSTADSDDVFTMIDHVLLHRDLLPSVRRVFVSRCTDLSTSDHWPVVVDLDLPDKLARRR